MVGKFVQQNFKADSAASERIENLPSKRNENWSFSVATICTQPRKDNKLWQLSYIPLLVVVILLFLIVLVPLLDQVDLRTQFLLNRKLSECCSICDKCRFEIVESIPEGLFYLNSSIKHKSTFEVWSNLIQISESTIEIGSFYWTLKKWDEFPVESKQGDEIFNGLMNAGLHRNISIKIAQNKPSSTLSRDDTEILIQKRAALVKSLDFDSLIGAGVLHSKFWIVDRKHIYIGSANMDWRALNQVKELGIVLYNCSCMAEDLAKIFEVYWMVGNQTTLPAKWPESVSTIYNSKNPFNLDLNGQKSQAYISSAPPEFSPKGRNDDLDSLLEIIRKAKKFIHISVMNYLPLILYSGNLKYWSVIDDELRKAVVDRHVEVRILTSQWPSTRQMEINFLNSLLALNKFRKNAVLEVKLFEVPSNSSQSKIPFARVNHNKYMVTDNGALIGTSNWSGDYFISTAGVSFISLSVNGSVNIVQQELKIIFDRDWNSPFAKPLPSQIHADV